MNNNNLTVVLIVIQFTFLTIMLTLINKRLNDVIKLQIIAVEHVQEMRIYNLKEERNTIKAGSERGACVNEF